MQNTQTVEKPKHIQSGIVDLHHVFPTMQGEGPFAGTAAVFVRLSGCNLCCPLCDTDYTSQRTAVKPEFIVDKVKACTTDDYATDLVVITGGEPFRQNIGPLVRVLVGLGYHVQIETNGTLYCAGFPYDDPNVTIVCSPKAGSINSKLAPHITALKYVVHADQIDQTDGLPITALGHSARPVTAKPPAGFDRIIYVQPVDVEDEVENKRHLDAAVRSCFRYGYTLCLQLHKLLDLE
jgi:organic radical activating enzyme